MERITSDIVIEILNAAPYSCNAENAPIRWAATFPASWRKSCSTCKTRIRNGSWSWKKSATAGGGIPWDLLPIIVQADLPHGLDLGVAGHGAVPLDRIMVETDAPYMAPTPYRGKRCDSRYVYRMAETIAQIKGLTTRDVTVNKAGMCQLDREFKFHEFFRFFYAEYIPQ